MEKIEKVNFDVAKLLNKLTFEQFNILLSKSTTKRKDYEDEDIKTEFSKLKNYTKEIIKSKNNHKVYYNYVEGKDFGRLQSKNCSLQRQFNGFRGLLSNNLTYDLDMNNCHPVILKNLCIKHSIEHTHMTNYIENREPYLEELMNELNISRDFAKVLFLKCINKEGLSPKYKGTTIKSKKFIDFDKETTNIINKLSEIYNDEFCKYIDDNTYNKKGKIVNLLLCKLENEALQKVIKHLEKKNIEVCTLMFDGCMIYIGNYDINNIIEELNLLFKSEGIKFSIKKHNIELLEELNKLVSLEDDIMEDTQFWDMLKLMNHSDLAKEYYKLNPNKYIYSIISGWYEYNDNNVLKNSKTAPYSLISSISNTLQEHFTEKRNKLLPTMETYDECMKLFKKAYVNVGTSTYVDGITKFLGNLYLIDRIDDKIDDNINLLAFDNCLYDYSIKDFRPIKTTDYISKTTKYSLDKNSNSILRAEIIKTIKSIFPNDEMYNYWMDTTALSFVTNKFESIYLQVGTGGNGKGLLSSILIKALGDYAYTADNTFLTSTIKGGAANPTLAKCKGIRYLLISEPDDGSDETKFNIDFIKLITGGDIITTRDLFKSNIEYKPQFTPFLQCNKIPKLPKIDGGIKRRLKIIPFPFNFVENPTKSNEKKVDLTLKEKIDQKYYNEFMLLLIERITNFNDTSITIPKEVKEETNEYFESNDPVKGWFNFNYELMTGNDDKEKKKNKIKSSEMFNLYNDNPDNTKLSNVKFMEYMKLNGIPLYSSMGYKYFYGLKRKEVEKPEENNNLFLDI